MRKLVIVLIVLILVVIAGILFILIKPSFSPESLSSSSSLEECNTLTYNGVGAFNILFFASKENAEEYSSFLLSKEPYNSNKAKFNIYYIKPETYKPACELYQGVAVLCYSKELIKKAASCPNDYIFVVEESQPSKIRSSAYMNVLSINSNHNKNVLLHEFGHVFANLADEYVPADLPKKSKNCVSSCDKFQNQEGAGCFEGCSKESYYRSIDAGVMRTLSSEEYGLFNKDLISNKLSQDTDNNEITASATQENSDADNCNLQEYYLIEGTIKNSELNVIKTTLEIGCAGKDGSGDYEFSLLLKDDSKYSSVEFNPEIIFIDAPDENAGTISSQERMQYFYLAVPAVKDSKSIKISKDSQDVAEINLERIGAIPC